jgi:hypothetical protein
MEGKDANVPIIPADITLPKSKYKFKDNITAPTGTQRATVNFHILHDVSPNTYIK